MSDSDERESAEEEQPVTDDKPTEASSPPAISQPETTADDGVAAKTIASLKAAGGTTVVSLKAASGRVVAEIRKLKLKTIDLRRAYLRLGKDAYEQRLTNDELSNRFAGIESVFAKIASFDSDIESYNEHRLAQLCTPKSLSIVAVISAIVLAWIAWSLIPARTTTPPISTARPNRTAPTMTPDPIITPDPIYAHFKSRFYASKKSFRETLAKEHGVEDFDDLPVEVRLKSDAEFAALSTQMFAEVDPPSVSVDASASRYVEAVKCNHPEVDDNSPYRGPVVHVPIVLSAKQAIPETEHTLSFRARGPSGGFFLTRKLSFPSSVSQGDRVEARASIPDDDIWKLYRITVFYSGSIDDD